MKSSSDYVPTVSMAAVGAVALVAGVAIHGMEKTSYSPVQDFCEDGNNFPVEPGVELDDGSYGWVSIEHSAYRSKLKVVPRGAGLLGPDGVFIRGTHQQICALLDGVETYSDLRRRALAFMDELAGPDERGRDEPDIVVEGSDVVGGCAVRRRIEVNPPEVGPHSHHRGEDLVWFEDFYQRGDNIGVLFGRPILDLAVQHGWDREQDLIRTSFPLDRTGGQMEDSLLIQSLVDVPGSPPRPSEWFNRSYVCPR